MLSYSIRKATPLEEAQRTWNTRPSQVDVQFNSLIEHHAQQLVKPFLNRDKDDHLTAEIAKKKLEKTKKLESEKGK